MKQFIILGIGLVFMLAACTDTEETINMSNIDEHLGKSDVQYVELREVSEMATAGYIEGFEIIPFHSVIIGTSLLHLPDNYQFHANHILDEEGIYALFDRDKTIFLSCRTGNRTSFMAAALEHLGYEVVNVGGIVDYRGINRVYPSS